ncbi:hypothetical protein E2562_006434 [Oryza meyeriana var. granulata]|uniref:Uncharacterized protein n=1 Tax=Oryza meyeriana var. granulata TaxID=110450 RepID=A0A6G1CNV1_9ORYZ|nr:hypothetical protein E2562_006434 [Oryza meyeriana var. granulata]
MATIFCSCYYNHAARAPLLRTSSSSLGFATSQLAGLSLGLSAVTATLVLSPKLHPIVEA